jgi:predicted Rossmann fold flavoprotein
MPELRNNLIIGGGLAGIQAALWCRLQGSGRQVTLLEKAPVILPLPGAGKTGRLIAGCRRVVSEGAVLRGGEAAGHLLSKWSGRANCEWLDSIGVELDYDEKESGWIVDFEKARQQIEAALERTGVQWITGFAAEMVSRGAGGFKVWSKDGQSAAGEKLLLATGGERNHGLKLASELGAAVEVPFAAFVRLRLASPKMGNELGSMTREVRLRCLRTGVDARGLLSVSGRGLEGPVVSVMSSRAGLTWSQLDYRLKLEVDWLPGQKGSTVRGELESRTVHGGRRMVGETPLFGLTARQWGYFLQSARIDPDTPWRRLKTKKLQALVQRLKAGIVNTGGMGLPSDERAWAGGVDLSSVHVGSFEAIHCPGLHFAGEMLDFLGEPGGAQANLSAASAHVAGSALALNPA